MAKVRISERQKKLIEEETLAFATCDLKSKPNCIAVGYCKVVDDDKILITDNYMNKTRLNLFKNNKVSIAVWSKDGEEGWQFKGNAEYLTSGKWKRMVDRMEENKRLLHKAAVLVTVQEIYDLAVWERD